MASSSPPEKETKNPSRLTSIFPGFKKPKSLKQDGAPLSGETKKSRRMKNLLKPLIKWGKSKHKTEEAKEDETTEKVPDVITEEESQEEKSQDPDEETKEDETTEQVPDAITEEESQEEKSQDPDEETLRYLCKYNRYYGSISNIFDKPTTIVSYHPLLVFFKSELPNGEDITGSQLWEELSRLNIRYRNLVAEKGKAAKRQDFLTSAEYGFFYLSKLAWEEGNDSDVELAKMEFEEEIYPSDLELAKMEFEEEIYPTDLELAKMKFEEEIYPSDLEVKVELRASDGHEFLVRPAVAFQLGVIRKGDMKPTTTQRVFYDLPGITQEALNFVVLHCNNQLKLYRNFNAEQTVQQLNLVTLFNVIQASHHLDIQSLMNLSCRSLVKKVDGKRYQEIINKIDSDTENVQNYNDTELISSILRKRGEEVLINVSSFWINMPWSPFVASFLSLVERRKRIVDQLALRMMNLELDMENKELEKIVHDLYLWIANEQELANRLDAAAFVRLLHIVKSDISCTKLKCWALKLLGFAVSEIFKEVLEEIPFLVKLLIKRDNLLRVATLYALKRLAVGSSAYKKAIIDNYALEEVLKISNEGYEPDFRFYAAKFLVVVCRGSGLPSEKVGVARDIIVNILKSEINHSTLNYKIVFPCYALQYLSYNEPLEMGEILLRMLIKFLWSKCTGISGSALGVVGNIVRLGKDSDIEFMISRCKLLECLGTILVISTCKKFQMEACQIISNIAARNKTSREEMAKANMTLCSLLEKDGSYVKMEVAWAILNGIYGNRKRQIDVYLTAEDYYDNI